MDLNALKAELTVDPLGRGYSAMDDKAAAASLNAINRTVNVESVTGQEVFEATTATDYAALSAAELQQFWGIIGMSEILVNAQNTRAALLGMFGPGTDTRANLAALQTTLVSRATELGLGPVKVGHVQEARK